MLLVRDEELACVRVLARVRHGQDPPFIMLEVGGDLVVEEPSIDRHASPPAGALRIAPLDGEEEERTSERCVRTARRRGRDDETTRDRSRTHLNHKALDIPVEPCPVVHARRAEAEEVFGWRWWVVGEWRTRMRGERDSYQIEELPRTEARPSDRRSSCAVCTPSSRGWNGIPFENLLWAEALKPSRRVARQPD